MQVHLHTSNISLLHCTNTVIAIQIQVSDEEDGYAHAEILVDPQKIFHLQGIKTGFTRDASLDPLNPGEGIGEAAGNSKKGTTKKPKACVVS